MSETGTIQWSESILTSRDLASLNGHRRLLIAPGTIVTPQAKDELRERGIELDTPGFDSEYILGIERSYPLLSSVIHSLVREGICFQLSKMSEGLTHDQWARELASQQCPCVVTLTDDPGLVCCVANKVNGIRAAVVSSIPSMGRVMLSLKPNFFAVEMPGRTWHEMRQILRLATEMTRECPEPLASTLREMES